MKLFQALFTLVISTIAPLSGLAADETVHQWGRFEASFTAASTYDNPVQEVRLEVEYTAPDGSVHKRLGFWDGDITWKARFSPTQLGTWSFNTISEDNGLNNQGGSFICMPYSGDNPLYQHGALKVSDNNRYFEYADETPYFFLADTVWNGALLSDLAGWDTFLNTRVDQHFTAIQFVTTQWRAAKTDAVGQTAFTGVKTVQVNPRFYQRMDPYFDRVNQKGMIAVPVLLWAIRGEDNPGYFLPEDQRAVMAEYQIARYGAHQVIWFLGGDGNYRGEEQAAPWRRIGRMVFGDNHHRIATMHPSGMSWVADEFRDEKWFSFLGYQSGHGDDDNLHRWTAAGPASTEWSKEPARPIINLEPNYEDHLAYQSRQPHPPLNIRRAAYWSLLCVPPAGVTYGGHGVWGWHAERGPAPAHPNTGDGDPWHVAMNMPGAQQMKHLYDFFGAIEWQRLRPDQSLVANQAKAAENFIVAARSDEGDMAVLYAPGGNSVRVNGESLNLPLRAKWYNPRTGAWTDEGLMKSKVQGFTKPNTKDWLLYLE